MAFLKLTQVIHKPVEEVFHTVIDVANFPKWNPTTPGARKLKPGETGEGTQFEMEIKGFGKTLQSLEEFKLNKQVRLVPHIKLLAGGHRTRIDHELEMTPKGMFKIFAPIMEMISRKNLRTTANALQNYLERG